MRICSCCGIEKSETEFRKRNNRPGGIGYHCKQCAAKKTRDYYERNREEVLVKAKEYRENEPEKIKESYANWFAKNPEHNRGRRRERHKERYNNDPNFHMACILRSRFREALKLSDVEKDASALDLLGCPVWHLWAHFDFLFRPGMTRENHGKVWEIDHIRPVSSFDLVDPEQQKKCFHWTNLQPLFIEENREKGCKYG